MQDFLSKINVCNVKANDTHSPPFQKTKNYLSIVRLYTLVINVTSLGKIRLLSNSLPRLLHLREMFCDVFVENSGMWAVHDNQFFHNIGVQSGH